jgi:hypothetical protein
MPVAELDISPYVGVPVKQGHIDFMSKQLDAYKRKAALHPEFEPYVHEIVKEITLTPSVWSLLARMVPQ